MELVKTTSFDNGATKLTLDNGFEGWLGEGETVADATTRLIDTFNAAQAEVEPSTAAAVVEVTTYVDGKPVVEVPVQEPVI